MDRNNFTPEGFKSLSRQEQDDFIQMIIKERVPCLYGLGKKHIDMEISKDTGLLKIELLRKYFIEGIAAPLPDVEKMHELVKDYKAKKELSDQHREMVEAVMDEMDNAGYDAARQTKMIAENMMSLIKFFSEYDKRQLTLMDLADTMTIIFQHFICEDESNKDKFYAGYGTTDLLDMGEVFGRDVIKTLKEHLWEDDMPDPGTMAISALYMLRYALKDTDLNLSPGLIDKVAEISGLELIDLGHGMQGLVKKRGTDNDNTSMKDKLKG